MSRLPKINLFNTLGDDRPTPSNPAAGGTMPALLGLRGLAAVSVVLFHINRQIKIDVPDWLWFVTTHFGHGVFLFFVLSAFSLSYTNVRRIGQPNWLVQYAIKRFFRIAPLFYAVLASELLRQYLSAGRIVSPDWQIFANITFTFGLVPHASMVWAGWTVGVEMLFYAVFPFLLIALTGTNRAILLLIVALAVSLVSRIIIGNIDLDTGRSPPWAYFSFQSNLWFFALGMVTFFFINWHTQLETIAHRTVSIFAGISIAILLWVSEALRFVPDWRIVRPDLLVFGIIFAILTAWQYLRPSWLLSNGLMRYLGDRSFSIYLCHPVFLFYFRDQIYMIHDFFVSRLGSPAFLVTSLTVMICLMAIVEVTFRAIELNGLRLSSMASRAVSRKPRATNQP
ncbi:acyltransferase [Ruegeria sp. HKCCC2117]|uniref:acyltransferase family protein n=1 Tax=Ruegeria sp. HKCCC2117 TaxID=2682992 RepID=UPI001488FDA7|nr:acyltransferase [Ruegeria sp. HKCCC2117]